MSNLLSLTLQDAFGRTTQRRYEIEEQLDLSAYIAVTATFIGELQDVTDLGLVRAQLILDHPTAGWSPVAGSNVDVGATFVGLIADGNGKKASHKVPGIKLALVNADGSVPITGAVSDYLAQFLTADDFMLSDGETIESWLSGKLDK